MFRIQSIEGSPPAVTNKQILDKIEELHAEQTDMRKEVNERYKSDYTKQFLLMLFTSGLAAMGVSTISEKDLSNPGLFLMGFIALATGSIGFFIWGLYEMWKNKRCYFFATTIILVSAIVVYWLLTSL